MNQCKTLKALVLGIITLTTLPALGAEKIEIDRVFSFSSHQSTYDDFSGVTLIVDTYTISSDPVVLDNNDYDQMRFTLSPGAGKRLVVDDVAVDVRQTARFQWEKWTGSLTQNSYTVTYTNGTGTLPPKAGPGFLTLSNNGSSLWAVAGFNTVADSFAYDALTLEATFGPFSGGGSYGNLQQNQLSFQYELPGNVPDPGRFTHINPHSLTASSTSGGSVTTPGEGTFTYDEGENVNLVATPDPGYHFVNWTGPVADVNAASTTVTVTADTTVTAHFVANGKIEIDRVFSFSGHEREVFDDVGEETVIRDVYTINTDAVVLDTNDYDQLILTLSAGAGQRFVANNVGRPVYTFIDLDWRIPPIAGNTVPTKTYTVTYTNGMGNLPSADGTGSFFLSNNSVWILANDQLTSATGSFAFDVLRIESSSFGPNHGDGTYNVNNKRIIFAYSIPGNVPDPGRFTRIVSGPKVSTRSARNIEQTSAFLVGTLDDDGDDTCEVRFRYWIADRKDQTEQTTSWQTVAEGDFFGELVSDLLSNTVYHYVAEARNSIGTDVGDVRQFSTLDASDPNNPPDHNNVPDPNMLFVDDNAPSDPGPNDLDVSDPNEDGTQDHPFDSIQEAIDAAKDKNTVQVAPGRYYEVLDMRGKAIYLNGLDPNMANINDLPIIDANGLGPVMTFDEGEDANCIISGFVLTGGWGEQAGAVLCISSSPILDHCLIVGNRFTDPNGGAVYLQDSNSVFVNVTITDNALVSSGAGFNGGVGVSLLNSYPVLANSILWNNLPVEILSLDLSAPDVRYSTVAGSWPGTGNLSDDPLFAAPGQWVDPNDPNVPLDPTDPAAIFLDGDYHLMSSTGRWNPLTDTWIMDDTTSPAIDAGDPLSDWSLEPAPNGARINQGAYGGTSQASQSNE